MKSVVSQMRNISTFSIVARDPKTGELGIAVQSKFLAVGAVVPWAKAGVGAIATQAAANLDYGELGLKLLKKGYSPQAVLDALLALDDGREDRIVDANGNSVTYTGKNCFPWAGGIAGQDFACQGNILVSEATVNALKESNCIGRCSGCWGRQEGSTISSTPCGQRKRQLRRLQRSIHRS